MIINSIKIYNFNNESCKVFFDVAFNNTINEALLN